jgi:hypothetical protein
VWPWVLSFSGVSVVAPPGRIRSLDDGLEAGAERVAVRQMRGHRVRTD